jgi:TRAP-type mannitol/chloroaromatic compound transport system permease small subunit
VAETLKAMGRIVRRHFLGLCGWIDRLTMALCVIAAAVLTAAVLVIVVLRYGFGVGFIQLQDTAGHAFAVLLILSIPACLARGGHVRVEVISERLPPAYLRAADALALAAFLVPVFGLLIWAWWPDLVYSWSIREASVETGGLGGLWLVKAALPLAAGLTILQGLAAVLRPAPAGPAAPGPAP